ncbi:hypothetical protein INH39_04970 [Massilia violaceinigra]|uniref:Uncharacterized protein n=1 Tax=Massilia violaceinigra TaxID=2045208 RepID=A0ABY4A8P8_9BURK|nr:hypothetical protein [Massilia violaceinigra]UOD31081.1 hypothetical protein INH39_04970 [Massilia violaceinigra]
MLKIDLHGPVIPGESAAGLHLGIELGDCFDLFKDHQFVRYYEGFNLNARIQSNRGLLRVDGLPGTSGATLFAGPDRVRLSFSARGVLGSMYVFQGYAGDYRGIKIGDPLSAIAGTEPVEYNSDDEMYYRVDHSGRILPGLAIVALEIDSTSNSQSVIKGFCVHDWALFQD